MFNILPMALCRTGHVCTVLSVLTGHIKTDGIQHENNEVNCERHTKVSKCFFRYAGLLITIISTLNFKTQASLSKTILFSKKQMSKYVKLNYLYTNSLYVLDRILSVEPQKQCQAFQEQVTGYARIILLIIKSLNVLRTIKMF